MMAVPPLAAPAHAQVRGGTLVIYGDDKCPTNDAGQEIYVCVRRDEAERFRIPKELREFEVTPENESWAQQQETGVEATEAGIGSCSAVGLGGATGCYGERADAYRAERRARKKAESNIPLP
ncbi:hypothetical protein GO308_16510 [Sphingomonas sp. SFZ2018-12]|nr:hypothetical protein [Sphingomonas sp. SFZ2018-12]